MAAFEKLEAVRNKNAGLIDYDVERGNALDEKYGSIGWYERASNYLTSRSDPYLEQSAEIMRMCAAGECTGFITLWWGIRCSPAKDTIDLAVAELPEDSIPDKKRSRKLNIHKSLHCDLTSRKAGKKEAM